MWSGPRNISTAMMRAFGARQDAHVSDEPLYAYYLKQTGLAHPLAAEIVETHENDWRRVVDELCGPTPQGEPIWYQKHMSHHLLDEVERDWLDGFQVAFLIREPRAMITSLIEKLGQIRIEDTGLPQQVELFRWQCERTGKTPAVVDAKETLLDPAGVLEQFCERVGVPYSDSMLRWKPGVHSTDGCWAEYWYGNTLESTTFSTYVPKDVPVPKQYEDLAVECEALYDEMAQHRIRAKASSK